MTALIVIGVILLVVVLVCFVPVGADIKREDGEFSLRGRIWLIPIRFTAGGKEEKPPSDKKKNKKKKQKKEEAEPAEKKRPSLALLKILLKNGYPLLCHIISHGKVDVLHLHFTSAGPDPSAAAMTYAAAGIAMDGLQRIGSGRIRCSDLRADVDFDGAEPVIDFHIRLTERVGSLLGAGIRLGIGFLRDFIPYKKEEKNNGKSSDR